MIYIENKKKKLEKLRKKYPSAEIIDLTSKSECEYVKFSPFYPIGNIPIPFSENNFGVSVEGIWQGLKVFESTGVDSSKFRISDMKNIKRTIRLNGKILGHQQGLYSSEILDYGTARKQIFIKCYNWVLANKLNDLYQTLLEKASSKDLVFLDYNTNENINDLSKPLSHASLVKKSLAEKTRLYATPLQGSFEF